MRSVSFLAILAGVASANPAPYWPRNEVSHVPTGQSSSTLLPPTSSVVSQPSGTGKSSLSSNPTSYSKSGTGGVSTSVSVPTGTGVVTGTETITTYTTTTVCPVTQTSGTQVITTLTTSTITVTSCKGGCSHQPTPPPSGGKNTTVIYPTSVVNPTTTPPVNPTSGSIVVPTVVTTTKFSQTLQSTSVGRNGASTIYSTYLTVNPVYGTSTIYNTYYPTVAPAPPVSQPNGNCPPQATVTVTVVATPVAATGYKTYTITESGKPTTITVPVYPPTSIPIETQPVSTPPAQSNTKSQPSGTGSIPYPTTSGAPYPSQSGGVSSSRTGPKPTNSAGYYGSW